MKRLYLLMLSVICGLVVAAQGDGGGADINVNVKETGSGAGFFTNPIVWVVGAAVFILLLVALLRRPRN